MVTRLIVSVFTNLMLCLHRVYIVILSFPLQIVCRYYIYLFICLHVLKQLNDLCFEGRW